MNAESARDSAPSSRFELGKAGAPGYRRERNRLSVAGAWEVAVGNGPTLRFRPGKARLYSAFFGVLACRITGRQTAPQRREASRARSRSAIFRYRSAFLTFFLCVDLSTAR